MLPPLKRLPKCDLSCSEDLYTTHRDLDAWYKDTYIGIDNLGCTVPAYVRYITCKDLPSGSGLYFNLAYNGSVRCVNYRHPRLRYNLPDFGMAEMRGKLVYLERRTERQWKRGNRMSLVHGKYITGVHAGRSFTLGRDREEDERVLYMFYNGVLSDDEPKHIVHRRLACVDSGSGVEELYYMGKLIGLRRGKRGILKHQAMAKPVSLIIKEVTGESIEFV